MYLIQKGTKTEYGQSYGFESLSNYDDFARNVPVGNYTTKAELIERTRSGESNVIWPSTIKWFAKSSGTSNSKSKFIPLALKLWKIATMPQVKTYSVFICTITQIQNCSSAKIYAWVAVKNSTKIRARSMEISLPF